VTRNFGSRCLLLQSPKKRPIQAQAWGGQDRRGPLWEGTTVGEPADVDGEVIAAHVARGLAWIGEPGGHANGLANHPPNPRPHVPCRHVAVRSLLERVRGDVYCARGGRDRNHIKPACFL
jgi:hypothetical protein